MNKITKNKVNGDKTKNPSIKFQGWSIRNDAGMYKHQQHGMARTLRIPPEYIKHEARGILQMFVILNINSTLGTSFINGWHLKAS